MGFQWGLNLLVVFLPLYSDFKHEYHGKNHTFSQTRKRLKFCSLPWLKKPLMYNAKWERQGIKTCEVHEFQETLNGELNPVLVVIVLIL